MSEDKIPDVLYKYCPPKRWKTIFEDWTIRFTPPSDLNDPFEWLPATDVCKEEKKSLFEAVKIFFYCAKKFIRSSYIKFLFICLLLFIFPVFTLIVTFVISCFFIYLAMFKSGHFKYFFNKFIVQAIRIIHGILCLSENRDNILMWSHYSDSHRGFVLCFDTKSSFLYMSNSDFKKVKYVNDRPVHGIDDDHNKYIFLKSDIWHYEKEWRYSNEIISGEHFIENNKILGITRLPRTAVVGVIFGESMKDSHIKARCRHIRSQPDCAHIKLQRARLHKSRYELIIEDIEQSFYQKKGK